MCVCVCVFAFFTFTDVPLGYTVSPIVRRHLRLEHHQTCECNHWCTHEHIHQIFFMVQRKSKPLKLSADRSGTIGQGGGWESRAVSATSRASPARGSSPWVFSRKSSNVYIISAEDQLREVLLIPCLRFPKAGQLRQNTSQRKTTQHTNRRSTTY